MPRPPGPLVLRKTYDNQKFADALQDLLNRMSLLVENLGPIEKNFPVPHHAWRSVADRVELYTKTGDKQFLLDAACYAMIEYVRPSIPKAWIDENPNTEPT